MSAPEVTAGGFHEVHEMLQASRRRSLRLVHEHKLLHYLHAFVATAMFSKCLHQIFSMEWNARQYCSRNMIYKPDVTAKPHICKWDQGFRKTHTSWVVGRVKLMTRACKPLSRPPGVALLDVMMMGHCSQHERHAL